MRSLLQLYNRSNSPPSFGLDGRAPSKVNRIRSISLVLMTNCNLTAWRKNKVRQFLLSKGCYLQIKKIEKHALTSFV